MSQSFHRGSEPGGSGLQADDLLKDWLALRWPYPTIVQAAGNFWLGDADGITPPEDEFVNHKGYNTLAIGNHDDTAGAMSGDSVFRNPTTTPWRSRAPGDGRQRHRRVGERREEVGHELRRPGDCGRDSAVAGCGWRAVLVAGGLPSDPDGFCRSQRLGKHVVAGRREPRRRARRSRGGRCPGRRA